MSILIYFILFCIILLFSYNKFHRVLNIVSLFSGVWFIFGILSCFGLYGLRIPETTIHIYVWTFVLIVDIIFLIFASNISIKLENNTNEAYIYRSRTNKMQIVTLVLITPFALKAISLFLSSSSLVYVRMMYFSGINFSSMYQEFFFRTIPIAFFNVLIIYYTFYSFETKNYKYLIYALMNTLLVTLLNGGRYALILLLYSIVILCITRKTDLIYSKQVFKYRNRIKRFSIIIIFLMLGITVIRGQKILRNIIIYFSGSLSYLDYIIQHPTWFALDKPLYGYFTLAAFIEPIVLIMKVLGLTSAKVPSYEFNIYCQSYYDIGNGSRYILFNSNTSIIYYFLRDFGTAGVIIGALFIGLIAVKSYNKWQKGSRFCGVLFLYLGNVMLNSLMTYQLIGPAPILIFMGLYLLTQNKFVIGKEYGGKK